MRALQGDVVLQSQSQDTVVLVVDAGPAPDGIADELYLIALQAGESAPSYFQGPAVLHVAQGTLHVVPEDGPRVVFAVSSDIAGGTHVAARAIAGYWGLAQPLQLERVLEHVRELPLTRIFDRAGAARERRQELAEIAEMQARFADEGGGDYTLSDDIDYPDYDGGSGSGGGPGCPVTSNCSTNCPKGACSVSCTAAKARCGCDTRGLPACFCANC